MIIKLINGSTILAEMTDSGKNAFILTSPYNIEHNFTEDGESTTLKVFMPGTDKETILISTSHIICVAPANEFFSKFYGSTLFKIYTRKLLSALDADAQIDNATIVDIENARLDILSRYGMIEQESISVPTNPNLSLH